jgi:short-subunit dehydrogenase
MSKFKNKTVLITGGASGIGKIMSRLAMEKGAKVIIFDINQEGINSTLQELSAIGEIHGFQVDISDITQLHQTVNLVKNQFQNIDILINNAGIVVGKYFHEHSESDIRRTMSTNTLSPMLLTNLLLPDMLARNSGHICNIASMAGLISNPKMAVYAASKWAVLGWSDSVRVEMQQLKKSVKITTIMPYYIQTGMFAGVHSLIPILKPEKTAKKIIRAIERNRIFKGMPWSYNFVRLMQGLMPVRLFDFIVGKGMKVYKTMEHFTGR